MESNKPNRKLGGRLLAAALTAVLTLWCTGAMYGSQYRWSDSEISAAHVLKEEVGWVERLEGAEFRTMGVVDGERERMVAFSVQNGPGNAHGMASFERGLNGKYRFVEASYGPMPFTSGVYVDPRPRGEDWERTYLFLGEGCRDMDAFRVTFDITEHGGGKVLRQETLTFPMEEGEFVLPVHTSQVPHGEDESVCLFYPDDIVLLDRDGNDVTAQYRDETVSTNWHAAVGGTTESAMTAIYVAMALAALLGAGVIWCLLRRK